MIDEKKLIESLKTDFYEHYSINHSTDEKDLFEMFIDNINEQPKLNEWIPVEKGLPKEHEIVLVAYLEYISNTKQLCEIAYINEYRTWSWYFNGTVVRNKIIAWMPLPKSYKRSDEDDE